MSLLFTFALCAATVFALFGSSMHIGSHHIKVPDELGAPLPGSSKVYVSSTFQDFPDTASVPLSKRQNWNENNGNCDAPNLFNGHNITVEAHKAAALTSIMGCLDDIRSHAWDLEKHKWMDWTKKWKCGWTATFFINESDTSHALDCIESCWECMRHAIGVGARSLECNAETRKNRFCRMGFLPWPMKLEDYFP